MSEQPPNVEAVDRAKDAHEHVLGLAAAAAEGDAAAVDEHSDELCAAVDDVQALVAEVSD